MAVDAGGIRAVAAFDLTAQRRAMAEGRGLRAAESLEQFYGGGDFEAVLVSTPSSMHFDDAMAAMSRGYHVMVEKPMGLNLAEAEQLLAASRRTNRVLSVFHNRRWDSDYLTAKQAIEAGTFGKVINIESRIGQWASCVGPAAKEWRPGWRNEASFGGGGLYDWGSHFVDQLWRMMLPARAVRVFAQLRGNVWTTDCDDFARVCVNFDDGAVGVVEINTTTTRPLPRWHIDGTKGSADAPFSATFDLGTWSKFTFSAADGGAASALPIAERGLSETDIWERFASAVRGEGEAAVPAESVLPTMRILDAARESSSLSEAVAL